MAHLTQENGGREGAVSRGEPGLVNPNVILISDLSNHAADFRFFSF